MTRTFAIASVSYLLATAGVSFAATNHVRSPQDEYERSIQAVFRNKDFYKAGRLELTASAGLMPYDSLVNHYLFGGRLAWHLSDHYGWEVLDLQAPYLASVTGFTTDLVQSKGISNLQTVKLRLLAATNLLLSPLYGKIRWFGHQVVHFDIYLVFGPGFARTETVKLSSASTGATAVESTVRTGFEPLINFGFGFKIFLTRSFGFVLDLRDYVVFSEVYGKRSPKSNFSVFAGLTLFFPTFG